MLYGRARYICTQRELRRRRSERTGCAGRQPFGYGRPGASTAKHSGQIVCEARGSIRHEAVSSLQEDEMRLFCAETAYAN